MSIFRSFTMTINLIIILSFSLFLFHPVYLSIATTLGRIFCAHFPYICNRDRKKVKQNFYDRDLSNDILVNNNVPNGIWDDNDVSVFYPDLQEMDDYQPYQPCT